MKKHTVVAVKGGWDALLERELDASNEPEFPEGSLTIPEIRQKRKDAGLTWGDVATRAWVNSEIAAGRIKQIEIHLRKGGRRVRAVKYLPV